eukprot:CAMPEP_0204598654 /NCGR_PEP_ID=MMETSP0661-20131031/54423_1 /ASSEMBLY_ACC=CAM_ASM_000606 /TAXON_ID=109239 /ORGANISM="Alexandrium margalefi, Strain AMGDE01CS-322" /LENGTH=308 /DNA_ID=CAMNT_0051609363 /DNA_START=63 /DNA_END=989 /DNA_ORIENTATION=-
MSAARFGGKWADVDEDEDEGMGLPGADAKNHRFETAADANGIKMVIEYIERDSKTYKVTTKVKQTKVTSWTNQAIASRKSGLSKFGKAASNDAQTEAQLVVKSAEEVPIEVTKKLGAVTVTKDDAEDKFYEDSLSFSANLNQEKKVWTDMNRIKQLGREDGEGVGVGANATREEEKEKTETATEATPAAGKGANPNRYVPPSIRSMQDGGKGDGKGKGKMDMAQQQEASLRVTNLSEDCREGDLQDLFGQCGRLQRVYLAKDMDTGLSRGFAFITYYTREDAQKAIAKLHGHGYDNLILQVQFAKPRV